MSEHNPTPEPETPVTRTAEPAGVEQAPAQPGPRAARWYAHPALYLALAALALVAWQGWDTRIQTDALRHELARRLAESDLAGRESRTLAAQAEQATREAQITLGVLEAKLAESQSQQVALEALYQELSRNRDETAVAEVEQLLLIAGQQLNLAGNVQAALSALQNADMRLARIDRPQLAPLRKLLAGDIEKLESLPHVDVTGISVRLERLIAAVDTLPLSTETRPPQTPAAASRIDPAQPLWLEFLRSTWEDLKQLVRIERISAPEPPLAPDQKFFLRENLKLRLLSARFALLARNEASYKADLKAAEQALGRHFDAERKPVAEALQTVRALAAGDIAIDLPDISGSLNAVSNLRLARDKGAR